VYGKLLQDKGFGPGCKNFTLTLAGDVGYSAGQATVKAGNAFFKILTLLPDPCRSLAASGPLVSPKSSDPYYNVTLLSAVSIGGNTEFSYAICLANTGKGQLGQDVSHFGIDYSCAPASPGE